jgi:hypothetical protein
MDGPARKPFWKTPAGWGVIFAGVTALAAVAAIIPLYATGGSPHGAGKPVLVIVQSSLKRVDAVVRRFRLRMEVQNVGNRPLFGCTGNEQLVDATGAPNKYLPSYFDSDVSLWSLPPGTKHVTGLVTSFEPPDAGHWLYIEQWVGCETEYLTSRSYFYAIYWPRQQVYWLLISRGDTSRHAHDRPWPTVLRRLRKRPCPSTTTSSCPEMPSLNLESAAKQSVP